MNGTKIVVDRTIDNDATIIIPNDPTQRDNAWVTIDFGPDRPKYSLNLVNRFDGIAVCLYLEGHEDTRSLGHIILEDAEAVEAVAS